MNYLSGKIHKSQVWLVMAGVFLILVLLKISFLSSLASAIDGTIDPNNVGNKYAWSDKMGWVNFGTGVGAGNIHVTAAGITGFAWSQSFGWINMAPASAGVTFAAPGQLTGSAWGENTGFIDFSGVSISTTGFFSGVATGSTAGTLTFNCPNCVVETDFRPFGAPGGGGGRRLLLDQDKTAAQPTVEVADEESALVDSLLPIANISSPEEQVVSSTNTGSSEEKLPAPMFGYQQKPLKAAAEKEPQLSPKCSNRLTDISENLEHMAIISTVDKSFFLCPESGLFRPDDPVTRADLIKLVAIGMGQDTEPTHGTRWYKKWWKFLVQTGVVKRSIPPKRFEPRADLLAVVAKAKGLSLAALPTCKTAPFEDVSVDIWYCPLVQYALIEGWIPAGTPWFAPFGVSQRSWAAGVVYRSFVLPE